MINHIFTKKDIFYAQYYRYFKMFVLLILLFGLFAIGVMVFSEAPLLIGILLFVAYSVMALIVMNILLVALAMFQYNSAYKGISYSYMIEDEYFVVCVEGEEIFRKQFEKLETKVYRKLTYIYEGEHVVAFFPESVRQQLLQ